MLSTLRGVRAVVPSVAQRSFVPSVQVAEFHVSHASLAKESEDGSYEVDKVNPLYAPDNFATWRNAGYKNLAPLGWSEWEDLPAPYKYYDVKLDPKDVEESGFFWKLFSNWKTGIPVAGIFSMPLFVYDAVLIDERMELMFIFWATIGIFHANFGHVLKNEFTSVIQEIKDELYGAEAKHNEALDSCLDTHKKAMHVVEYLQMINGGERALAKIENAALNRSVLIDERNKMVAMLDFLVQQEESRVSARDAAVALSARTATEGVVEGDDKVQQKTIADAITALKSSVDTSELVSELFQKEYDAAVTAAAAASATDADVARARDMFSRRFGFSDTVTEEMMKAAESSETEMAILTAKCAGAKPAVGVAMATKMPIDY